jgi:hypothetical protein
MMPIDDELTTQELNDLYDKTGGCFGPDPDAYGKAVDAARDAKRRRPFQCCDQAVMTDCVCAWSYHCEVHGDKHIGTHE